MSQGRGIREWLAELAPGLGVPGQALVHGLCALSRARPPGARVAAINQVLEQQHTRLRAPC